jgi:hypothetical protein
VEKSREVREVSEKIEQFWRDADGADVMRVMDGQTVEARFRDEESEGWRDGEFLGGYRRYHKLAPRFIDLDGATYLQCQVYDPPEWFVNKPEPGEGFRLLEKFPPEPKLATDDYWSDLYKGWRESGSGDGDQNENVWYRRRIETNNPEMPDSSNSSEVPNSCRSRDNIPSGWRLLGKDEERLASDLYWSQGCKEWLLIGDDRVAIANELPRWYAIRQIVVADFFLLEGYDYSMPGGQTIRVTEKGFEVL